MVNFSKKYIAQALKQYDFIKDGEYLYSTEIRKAAYKRYGILDQFRESPKRVIIKH